VHFNAPYDFIVRHMPPKPIAEVLAQLMARRGYAREQTAAAYGEAWRRAVGEPMNQFTQAGQLKRGALEITVANSVLVQELGYRKTELLAKLTQLLPDQNIQSLRFRVGTVV
jgi:predicted nucleic acid-binding Zn ribbon protein